MHQASHTGKELALMLAGLKPLAAFVELLPDDAGKGIIPETDFEPHVQSSKIVKFEYQYISTRMPGKTFRRVLYALPGQTWRFNSHQMLWFLAEKYGWNEGFERVEGFLLGYES